MPPLQGLKEFGGAVSLRSLDEVKFMIHREQKPVRGHLLELPQFRDSFYAGSLEEMARQSSFHLAKE